MRPSCSQYGCSLLAAIGAVMSFKKTIRKIRATNAADEAAETSESSPSNGLLNGLMSRREGLSDRELGVLDRAYEGLDAVDFEFAMEKPALAEEEGILALAASKFVRRTGQLEWAMERGETALVNAQVVGWLTGSAATADEQALVQGLEDEASVHEGRLDALHANAREHYRLPVGPLDIAHGARPRTTEITRVGDQLQIDIEDAYAAAMAFGRATDDVSVVGAVRPFTSDVPGKNAYVIGACLERSEHDEAQTGAFGRALCENFGVSAARFPIVMLAGLQSLEEDPGGEFGDLNPTLLHLKKPLEAAANGHFDAELQPPSNLPDFVEHATPLLRAYRFHAFLCDVARISSEATKGYDAVDQGEISLAQDMLTQAQAMFPTLQAEVNGLLQTAEIMRYSSAYPHLNEHIIAIETSGYDSFDMTSLLDHEVRVGVVAGGEQSAGEQTLLTDPPSSEDVDALIQAAVAAADGVEDAALGLGTTVLKSKVLSNVRAFSKLNLKYMKIQEVYAHAEALGLAKGGDWKDVTAWTGMADTVIGGVKYATDSTAKALTAAAYQYAVPGGDSWDKFDLYRGQAGQLKKASAALGAFGKFSSAVSTLDAMGTLLSSKASVGDKAQAGLSLLGNQAARVGLGGVAGVGMAYLSLLRAEFKRMELAKKATYAVLSEEAYSSVRSSMARAERLSTRLAAAPALYDPSKGEDDPGNQKVMDVLHELSGVTLRATTSVNDACVESLDTVHRVDPFAWTEATVDWAPDQLLLKRQYQADTGDAAAALDAHGSADPYETILDALKLGGPAVFQGAGNLAGGIAALYAMRTQD